MARLDLTSQVRLNAIFWKWTTKLYIFHAGILEPHKVILRDRGEASWVSVTLQIRVLLHFCLVGLFAKDLSWEKKVIMLSFKNYLDNH